jgi:hypothetical protein
MSTITRGLHHASLRAIATIRRWFDPPIEADSRPLEIREAVVDRVEQKAEPAAAGRRVLPHNHVIVTVVAADRNDRTTLDAALDGLDGALRTRLAELRCPVPAGFEVEIRYLKRPKPGWPSGQRFSVDLDTRAITRASKPSAATPPALDITIARGRATQPSYRLALPIVRIGRTALPTDQRGRPRHNDVVFVEEGDEHSATVGRAHASIHFDAARGEYRLFDDGSHNGTRVVRGASTLNVTAGNPVGVRLLTGDEIQFGTAAVRIVIDAEGRAPEAGRPNQSDILKG